MMAGWITNGVPQQTLWTGAELFDLDTQLANGSNPQTASTNFVQQIAAGLYFGQVKDKTMVSGSRYYSALVIGNPATITGVQVLIGTTGGTDNWLAELHSPTGVLLATSALAGALVGTASTWQRFVFTATYNLTVPGTYWIAIQGNGNTAKLATLNSDVNPTFTGSATGSFGTSASITPPTTYTANLGPMGLVY
jgi:hypothetical protein